MKRLILFTTLLSIVPLPLCFAQPDQMTVQENRAKAMELLDKYARALDSTFSFIDHYEMSRKYSYQMTGQQQSEGEKFSYGQHRHDDQRIYHHRYSWGDFPYEKMPKDSPYYNINIFDGRKGMTYQNHGRPKTFGTKALGNHTEPSKMNLSRTFAYKINLSRNPGVSYIAGYIGSDERLDKILSKADAISVRETTENIRGSECFVIDADTKYGQYTVWLDPEHGYHPAKVRHESGEGDHHHHLINPEGSIGFTYLDTVRFETVDGTWVPMEADGGHDRKIAVGRFSKEDMHYKRTQIILNPDHDKLGSFADPLFEDPNNDPELVNGTAVFLDDDANTEYTWLDGKLIDPNGRVVDLHK